MRKEQTNRIIFCMQKKKETGKEGEKKFHCYHLFNLTDCLRKFFVRAKNGKSNVKSFVI